MDIKIFGHDRKTLFEAFDKATRSKTSGQKDNYEFLYLIKIGRNPFLFFYDLPDSCSLRLNADVLYRFDLKKPNPF